ncbi:MAG: hypothetical protein WD151_10650 [Phycisphaeraceae bacterium]
MPHRRGLTLVETLTVVVAVAITLALGWIVFIHNPRPHHRGAPRMQNNTQLRGIHQSMVMYAQGNGGHFPGLDRHGDPAALAVEDRLKILLDGNYFTPEYLISPSETDPAIHEWQPGSAFTADNHSYALLQVPVAGGRHAEWSETLNTEAIVMSDRNTGASPSDADVQSIHTNTPGDWRGGVAHNDNSVVFETTHRLPTRFDFDPANQLADDHLFEADSDNDAYLIHSGN